jgi:two-component system, LytTR family, response regulator AlgR
MSALERNTGVMQVLVVDDEALARQRSVRMIENIEGYDVVGEASNGEEALTAIQTLDPDIVLLDIRMPGEDGLATARRIAQLSEPPAVIFCTAFNEYALEAFDTLAIGYLLKPLQKEQLQSALVKASRLNKVQMAARDNDDDGVERRKHIAAKTRRGLELVPIEDIYCFVADQKYVTVMHAGGETLIDDTLKELEREFGREFVRVHRNALVAVSEIEKLERMSSGQYELQLKHMKHRPVVSRRHVSAVRDLLEHL